MEEHTKTETNPKNIKFSEIVKIEKGKLKDEINFILENGEIITKKIESCSKFVDPAYDSVFKAIFGDGNIIDEKGGKERLLNLLNSLLFPNEETKGFIDIHSISNEKSKITTKQNNSGILRFDISCKATLYNDKNEKKTKIIDIEMQIGKKTGILSRMKNYAYDLFQTYETETILIAFMNQEQINKENSSQYTITYLYDSKGEVIEEEQDIDIMIINLKQEIEKNQAKQKIIVRNKELNKVGISWLKLLGIRHWGKISKKFYYLPKNVCFLSKELNTAFKLLQSYDDGQLEKLLRKEEEDRNILKIYEEEGEKRGEKKGEEKGKKIGKMKQILGSLLNIFEHKKESFDEMIDFIDYEKNDFESKDIEVMISDENKRNEFLKLLGKKRKIK